MNHDLYFVAILAEALRGPDRRESLEKAFGTIERLAHEPGYAEGYRNYRRFMAEVAEHRQLLDEDDLRTAMLEWATGVRDEADRWDSVLSRLVEKNPWLKDESEALRQVGGAETRLFHLHLLGEGRQIAELTFETTQGQRLVDDLRPGRYCLRLDTGLTLWEETLTAADLIWSEAFGGEGLALAAETGDVRRRASREIKVPAACLTLRILPGIETGTMEIVLLR